MPKIYSYSKITDKFTTYIITGPDYKEGEDHITELCTIDGTTYVSVPDSVVLPIQPGQITLKEVATLTPELRKKLKGASPHIQLIEQRVRNKIAEKYSIYYEIKALRKKDKDRDAFDAYDAYVEECVAWGDEEKKKLGIT